MKKKKLPNGRYKYKVMCATLGDEQLSKLDKFTQISRSSLLRAIIDSVNIDDVKIKIGKYGVLSEVVINGKSYKAKKPTRKKS